MVLNYSNRTTIGELKAQFSSIFSFLKLEFLMSRPRKGERLSEHSIYNESTRLTDLNIEKRVGNILFNPSISISYFQKEMQEIFKIPVQVFRKAGDMWIEIHQTENLSLAQQDKLGKSAPKSFRVNVNTLFL